MKSVRAMIDQLEGLLGTEDVNEWESGFIASMVERRDSLTFSAKQVEMIDKLYGKHFAG